MADPVVRITTRSHFSSAHRLHNDARDAAWNRDVFGKCNNPYAHGHTYELEVTVEGPVDRESGWILDFGDLKRIVAEKVVKKCDLRNLNRDVPFLSGVNPTAENIAVKIWEELSGNVAPARLVRVVLHETERNKVIFTGPEARGDGETPAIEACEP
jgi:6-pyruvoyltetrahydropterin/6-carboxytetrahydropterin synthase